MNLTRLRWPCYGEKWLLNFLACGQPHLHMPQAGKVGLAGAQATPFTLYCRACAKVLR